MNVILVFSAIVGLYISTYFTLVYYRKIGPETRFIPSFCSLDEQTCQRVIFHPHARIFLLPNFVLGIVYYLFVLLRAFSGPDFVLSGILLYASWLTVIAAIFLSYSLFFVVRIICPLCLTAHGINILIAWILTHRTL